MFSAAKNVPIGDTDVVIFAMFYWALLVRIHDGIRQVWNDHEKRGEAE